MHNLIPNLPCHPSPLEFRIILRKSQVTIGADISVSRQNRRDGEHTHYVVVLYRLGTTGKNTQYQYHEFLVVNTSSLENRRPSGDETSLYFSFIQPPFIHFKSNTTHSGEYLHYRRVGHGSPQLLHFAMTRQTPKKCLITFKVVLPFAKVQNKLSFTAICQPTREPRQGPSV